MASVAALAKYKRAAAAVIAKLRDKGYVESFGTLAPGATSADRPGDYVETGAAGVFPLEWQADFSNDVLATDKFFMVSNEVDIKACTHMGGKANRITKPVKTFKPDGATVVYYEIQVRSS